MTPVRKCSPLFCIRPVKTPSGPRLSSAAGRPHLHLTNPGNPNLRKTRLA